MKNIPILYGLAAGGLVLAVLDARAHHRFDSIGFREGRPQLSWSWAPHEHEVGSMMELFFAHSLTGRWHWVNTIEVREGMTNSEYRLAASQSVGGCGFFRVHEFADDDGDGISNVREELEFGSDPNSIDTDYDTIPDDYEIAHGMDPTYYDSDDDGVTDEFEVRFGSNPLYWDTDGDGLSDYDEWLVYGTSMTFWDTDYDEVTDADEIRYGSDPLRDYSIMANVPDRMAIHLRGYLPEDLAPNSTNCIWEHLFYTGTIDTPFKYPVEDDAHALLRINASGYGAATVYIDGQPYRIYRFADSSSETVKSVTRVKTSGGEGSEGGEGTEEEETNDDLKLLAKLVKGVKMKVIVDTEGLDISLSSDNYMIGEMPRRSSESLYDVGWICFPNTLTSCPCVHTKKFQRTILTLSPGLDVTDLTCTWEGGDGAAVENLTPLTAVVEGEFTPGVLESITYRLSHPNYLCGEDTFSQRAAYCRLALEEEEENDRNGGGDDADEYDFVIDGYEIVADDDSKDYEDLRELPPVENVLLLRESPVVLPIQVSVDHDCAACCACPEHFAGSVQLRYQDKKLRVYREDGENFNVTAVDTTVYVAGTAASKSVGDAPLVFTRAGEDYQKYFFTVLGLGIAVQGINLEEWNQYVDYQGFPMLAAGLRYYTKNWATEQVPNGLEMQLLYNVGLSSGRVRLALSDTEGWFQLWAYNHEVSWWECLLDSSCEPSVSMCAAEWRRYAADGKASVILAAHVAGVTRLEYSYGLNHGGRVIGDKVEQRFAAGSPRLVFDYDRDGKITVEEEELAASGERVFRFWINDDQDAEEGVGGLDDQPTSKGNADDDVVNGRRDLVDLVPLYVDLRAACPSNLTDKLRDGMNWRLVSSCVKVMETALTCETANRFQTEDCGNVFGEGRTRSIFAARLNSAADGYELSRGFARAASLAEMGSGILLMEGAGAGNDLALEAWATVNGREVRLMSYPVKIEISSVEDMYRWISLRNLQALSDSGTPSNRDDEVQPGIKKVFVHGFNVNYDEARAWAAEMFKRFWQAGLDDEFVALDWTGDSSQFHSVLKDDNYAPDYYVNVRNAFATAERLPAALAAFSGKIDLIGHSLGNMVVSSAIADYGLQHCHYYMLNAAVPMEAYDDSAYAEAMVDTEWKRVPSDYWASNWSGLFDFWDFRSSLSWRGRFAGLQGVINCYSKTEDVLGNPSVGQLTYSGGAWKIQELSKGTTTWYDLNALSLGHLDVVCEGGWGINANYGVNPLWYIYQYGFTSRAQDRTTREVAITEPLFTPFKTLEAAMASLDVMTLEASEDYRAKLLGDAIPATSFAQGANAAPNLPTWRNWSLTDLADHQDTWPRGTEEDGTCRWRHSDVKNLSYFYVHRWFEKVVKDKEDMQ